MVLLHNTKSNEKCFFSSFFSLKKIKAVYQKDPAKYVTLQDILESEREAHGAEWPKVGATLALMWLKRCGDSELSLISCMLNFKLLAGGHGFWMLAVSCRGLRFIQILLQSLTDGERDEKNPNLIHVNVTKAYEQALKKYHGWIVQKVFSVRNAVLFFYHRVLL